MPDAENKITIRTEGTSDDLFELLQWLNENDELRGQVELPTQAARPDDMGGLSEVLLVALGGGGALTALVSSLTSWFTVRRSEVTIRVKGGEEPEITLDAKRVRLPEVTAALQSLLEQTGNDR